MAESVTAAPTKQPNSLNCFVCGVENPVGLHLAFYEQPGGEVTCDVTLPERYQGYPGVVHGGIVASMLDEIAGRAAMQGNVERFMMTAKLEVRYRKPVPIGQPLRLVGRLDHRRGRLTVVQGEIRLSMEAWPPRPRRCSPISPTSSRVSPTRSALAGASTGR